MKKLAAGIMAVALILGFASTASAGDDHHHGGHYPPRKPMVAPGRSVIGPQDTTVGIYATRFCPNETIFFKLTKRGAPTISRSKVADGQGSATIWVNTSVLKPGTYKITATQPACRLSAHSHVTYKKKRHSLGVAVDSKTSGALGDLAASMDERAAAAADRIPVPALTSSGQPSGGLQIVQLTLVALLCGSGITAVNVRRRRTRTLSVNQT